MGAMETYSANEPNVVAEHFGAETVIVNLETGVYYNLRGTAHDVWTMVVDSGFSTEDAVRAMHANHMTDAATIGRDVDEFIDSLLRENLITRSDGRVATDRPSDPADAQAEWVRPVLEIFSDLKDILLLDPVHDVDEHGWPNPRTNDDSVPSREP
jgi:hypothetical protein